MSSKPTYGKVINSEELTGVGLNTSILRTAIQYTHEVLDRIDGTLVESESVRLASLVELANLSAIVGNLFRNGVSRGSHGAFKANKPHTFPDLAAVALGAQDLEIKVALESNKPKGHLIKPGLHLTVRYVLGDRHGNYIRGKSSRGDVVWIWEVRLGFLMEEHFSFSNTPGDSGKTAVINSEGMKALVPVFVDLAKCPYSPKGSVSWQLRLLEESQTARTGHSRD